MMHLYVAERDGLAKVGISSDPARRALAQRATLVWSQAHPGAGGVEGRACEMMRRKKVPGKKEWFAVSPAVAIRAVRKAMQLSFYARMKDEWAAELQKGAGK